MICTPFCYECLVKYADDTNLLVPENTDVPLADEYAQIKGCAVKNWVKINPEKKLKNWCFDDLIQRSGMCLLLSRVFSMSRLLSCLVLFFSVILTLHLMLLLL